MITNFKQFNINETFEDEYHEKIGEDYPSNYVEDIITKELGFKQNTYSGSADWGDCRVWSIDSKDGYEGRFVIVIPENDDEVVLLDRYVNRDDENVDTDYMYANNLEELSKLLDMVKNPTKLNKLISAKKFKLI